MILYFTFDSTQRHLCEESAQEFHGLALPYELMNSYQLLASPQRLLIY